MQNESNNEANNSKSKFNGSTLVEEIPENINNFANIEFNSADDVRQRMKAVNTHTMPYVSGETPQTLINDSNTLKNNRQFKGIKIREDDLSKTYEQNESKFNTSRPIQITEIRLNKNATSIRKRPGRPPKAGTSRKQKKYSTSSMYLGKLSNVVRRRYESESESDSELS